MALAREAAPHIRRKGEKCLPNSLMEKKGHGKSTMDSVLEVAASGLQGTPELLFFCFFPNTGSYRIAILKVPIS